MENRSFARQKTNEVQLTLEMFEALLLSIEYLKEDEVKKIDKRKALFLGYDGKSELDYMNYVCFLYEQGKFHSVLKECENLKNNFNSFWPWRENRYLDMLNRYHEIKKESSYSRKEQRLNLSEIEYILEGHKDLP